MKNNENGLMNGEGLNNKYMIRWFFSCSLVVFSIEWRAQASGVFPFPLHFINWKNKFWFYIIWKNVRPIVNPILLRRRQPEPPDIYYITADLCDYECDNTI